jgi:hypothetical protein
MSPSSQALSNLRAIVILIVLVQRIPFGAQLIGNPRRAVATP